MSKKNRGKRKNLLFMHKKHNNRTDVTNIPKELYSGSSNDYVLTNQEEMSILSRYILDYKNIETGGQLFGYWTFDCKPVVLFVLGPGPKAGHYSAFFLQDLEYLRERALLLKREYGLDHIGEWHSHHQLGLSQPSGHDSKNISTNMRILGYKKFLLCIGTCTNSESSINAFIFNSDKEGYIQIPWVIKNIESPFRKILSLNDELLFNQPVTKQPNMGQLYLKDSYQTRKIDYSVSYWLKQKGNSRILNSIINKLMELYPSLSFIPTIDNNKEVHLEVCSGDALLEDIHFAKAFPFDQPLIYDTIGNVLSSSTRWHFDGDILKSFITYYKTIKDNIYDERQ